MMENPCNMPHNKIARIIKSIDLSPHYSYGSAKESNSWLMGHSPREYFGSRVDSTKPDSY